MSRITYTFFLVLVLGLCFNGAAQSGFQKDSLRVEELIALSYSLSAKQTDSAMAVAEKAVELARSIDSEILVAKAEDELGTRERQAGNWKRALQLTSRAMKVYEKYNRPELLSRGYVRLGNISLSEGTLQERSGAMALADSIYRVALNYYHKAEQLAGAPEKYTDLNALVYMSLGNAHYKLFEDRQALGNYHLADRYYGWLNDTANQAAIALNMAGVYSAMGKADSATLFDKRAYNFFKETGNLKNLAFSCINLAADYGEENLAKNVDYLLEADSVLKILKNSIQRTLVLENLHSIYRQMGNYEEALIHLEAYNAIKDSLLNKEFKTEELNVRYETARQKEMLEKQRAENLRKELALQKSQAEAQTLRYWTVGGSIALLAIIGFLWWRYRTRTLIQKQKVQLHQQKIKDLEKSKKLESIKAMIQGQERERLRIAEELHDKLGGTLVAARMWNEVALGDGPGDDNLRQTQKLLDRAIDDSRNISHNLLPGVLSKFGLVAAINDLIENTSVPGGMEIHFEHDSLPELEGTVAFQLFRITQELVNNAVKHSQAKHLNIVLSIDGESLKLSVIDDGQGFDTEDYSDGIGLENVKRRTEVLDGNIEIEALPGKGSHFTIICNYKSNEAHASDFS